MINLVKRFTSTGFLFQTEDKYVILLNTSTGVIYDRITKSTITETSFNCYLSSTSFTLSRLFFDSLVDNYDDLEHCFHSILPNINKYKEHLVYIANFTK